MQSLGAKIEKLQGLCGTRDLTPWEEGFVHDIWLASWKGKQTSCLSEKQVAVVERIYGKHFGG